MKARGDRKKTRSRLELTLFFSVVIFLCVFAAVSAAGGILLVLTRRGAASGGAPPRTGTVIFRLLLLSLAPAAVLSVVLSETILRPVNRVIDAMNALAHGDFKTRLALPAGPGARFAAAEVTDSFNHMAEELDRTEMLRSDFVDNFSHEFKTPIVSIAGFADLLLEGELSAQERQEYIRIISEESHRLADMASNVLNLTRIENQTILTGVTCFNLSEQIRSCLLLLEPEWTEKRLILDVDFGEYRCSGNRELLKQVWLNLIDNAVKFADEGGTLRIEIVETPDDLLVSVSDTGREIPPESLPYIFNKFYQADESHATRGYGIGLSVVKAIVGLHGGRVIPESGGGRTVFTVVLPKNGTALLP